MVVVYALRYIDALEILVLDFRHRLENRDVFGKVVVDQILIGGSTFVLDTTTTIRESRDSSKFRECYHANGVT
jgi:hypothetical protein